MDKRIVAKELIYISKLVSGFEKRPIYEIANEIREDWQNVNFAAKPYLEAMFSLKDINDKYGLDDAKMILAYFLSNAATWRGDTAKRIKKEINDLIKKG